MTPNEFKERMIAICEACSDDREVRHIRMDDLIVTVLCELGYKEGVDIFIDTPKWYA